MSRGRRGATFSPVAPHFFKIILGETLREKRLLIPKKFVRLYGQSLSNSVFVKLPCGSEWEMEVEVCEGRVWLGKGWEKFAEHYSIVRGHMLCFRYVGNSKFEAVIYDTSTVEIDYPCKRRNCEDSCFENLDGFIALPRTCKKSQSPCSRDGKRRRIGPVAERAINLSRSKPKGSRRNKTVLQVSERKGDSHSFDSEMEARQDLPSTSDVKRKPSPTSCNLSENFKFVKQLDRYQKSAALEKASWFTSDHPFFKVVMQPHYVNNHDLNIPKDFANKYFENKLTNAILKVPNARNETWPVKQKFVSSCGNVKAVFNCGWKEFVRGNNLEVGDVCVFVLRKGIEVTYEVVIFRVKGNSKPPNSSAFRAGSTQVDRCEKSSPNKTEPGVDIEKRTPTDKDRLLKRAHFVSEKPFFKLFIQPSYTGVRSCMSIPLDIAWKYFKKEGDIILRVPTRGSWSVQFKMWHLKKTRRPMAELVGGWKVFAKGNNLKAGDVCIFQLVDGNKTSFDVSIIRVPKDDPYRQQFKEENDSETDGAIKNETSTYSWRKTGPIQVATTRQRALTVVEKTKFLERAHFGSKNPFFKVVMQPSYTGIAYQMPVPYEFAWKYIKEDRDAILRVQHGTRSWPVRFKLRRLKSSQLIAEISNGWKEFAESNNLEVGDVCIFELTNKTNLSFDVCIVQAGVDDVRQQRSQDGDSSNCSDKIQRETKRVKIEVD